MNAPPLAVLSAYRPMTTQYKVEDSLSLYYTLKCQRLLFQFRKKIKDDFRFIRMLHLQWQRVLLGCMHGASYEIYAYLP